MHSIARENLQQYLYSYKQTPKEPGLPILFDSKHTHCVRRTVEEQNALNSLRNVLSKKVAFAVHCHVSYDGSLENECPFYEKVISFEKDQFLHIYERYNDDWWLGRVVSNDTTIGFIPTSKRLWRLKELQIAEEEAPESTSKNRRIRRKSNSETLIKSQSAIWEWPSPYTVVPSTRPILFIGPCNQSCRLTELMHAAVQSAIAKHFGSRLVRLQTEIGLRVHSRRDFEVNERELRLITALADDLKLVLLESPHIDGPSDLKGLHLAPIIVLFRIRNRKILIKLLKKSGNKISGELAGADSLNALTEDQVNLIIEDNGLPEAIRRITNYLEDYWKAVHPEKPLLEEKYLEDD